MEITAKIIHCNIEHATMMQRGMDNYFKRREILFNETIPNLKAIGIESSIVDAIMYPLLNYNREDENKIFNPLKKLIHLEQEYTLDNPHPCAFEIALCMGHLLAWQGEVNVLVLEDDVIIPDDTEVIKKSIEDFLKIEQPAILYLQATNGNTVIPKIHLKTYNKDKISIATENLYKVDSDYEDWSGSAAYVLNKQGCLNLINRAKTSGLRASDGFIHRAIQAKDIVAYIPINYEKSILCHPTLS
jgi:GR25 family glycosyltransferase involved in LPS biosynthesis